MAYRLLTTRSLSDVTRCKLQKLVAATSFDDVMCEAMVTEHALRRALAGGNLTEANHAKLAAFTKRQHRALQESA